MVERLRPRAEKEELAVTRRILTIKGSFDDAMGGSVVAALNRSKTAEMNGWQVTVATTSDGRDTRSLLAAHAFETKVFRRRFPRRYASSPSMLWWLLRNAKKFDLIEVHEVFAFPTLYARVAAGLKGVPLIIHPNNSLDPYDLKKHATLKRSLRFIYRWLLRRTDALWLASSLEADRIQTFGVKVKAFVSPLPVEIGHLSSRNTERTTPPSVLFLGRLDPKKGIERLIRAVALAQRAGNQLRLIIAGSGDPTYAASLAELAKSELAKNSYVFSGHVSGEARRRLFQGASLFVLHSDNENFGIAVVEALDAGLPAVLSPEVYIAGDLEAEGLVTVVPVDDIQRLADVVSHHASMEPGERETLSARAIESAKKYGYSKCSVKDEEIRRQIVRTHRSRR
jgi:glycosyltransferase involved in cell wall biosynthesis